MSPQQANARSIFLEAVEKYSPDQWGGYLDHACGDDVALREHVAALLRAHGEPNRLLDGDGLVGTVDVVPLAEKPGMIIGRYQLVEELGEGGMGVVHKALQQEPVRREVALKIIKPGMDTREVIARFEAERQALAMMDHQGVAHVLDGGSTESGRPYFVMELVEGTPITDYCDACRYTTRERLELFVEVCHAVHHAHQKGVIHRDLKPSNILVTAVDNVPIPKVIDFGIAKAVHGPLTDQSLHTHATQLVGTPLYMSPEQAKQTGQDVDIRTDVYSLGVVLYELLTGTMPFDRERLRSSGWDEVKRILREEEPPRPSSRLSTVDAARETVAEHHHTDLRTLRRELRGELDWIVMKAMEKDRARRYASAHDLAEDVHRYLNDEAVEACPPTTAYRLKKLARRNKAPVAAVASVALALLLGAAIATDQAVRATEAERIAKRQQRVAEEQEKLAKEQQRLAEEQREATEDILYVAHMGLTQKDWEEGHTMRLHNLLERHLPQPGGPDRRGWEWYYWLSLCHRDKMTLQSRSLSSPFGSWSPDGQYIASASEDEAVIVSDAKTGEKLITVCGPGCSCVAWSPDGERLAAGDNRGRIRVYAMPSADHVLTIQSHARAVDLLSWSPDGRHLASVRWLSSPGDKHPVKIWNPETGKQEQILSGHTSRILSVSWHPSGTRLATASCDFTVRIWDVETGRAERVFQPHWCEAFAVAWSPDGTRLATSGFGASNAKVWDPETGEMLLCLDHSAPVDDIAWSPDNRHLATGTWSHNVRVWNTFTGTEAFTLRGHKLRVRSVQWSPDGQQILSTSDDRTIKIWNADKQQDSVTRRLPEGPIAKNARHRTTTPWPIIPEDCAVWSPTGERAAWKVEGHAVAIGDPTSTEDVLKFDTGHVEVYGIVWGPHGKRLATSCLSGEVKIWRVRGWHQLHTLRGHADGHYVNALGWTRDGRRLASGGWDQTVKIWDTEEGREICSLLGHTDRIRSVAWSPDGKRLASTGKEGVLKLWDPATGYEVLSFGGCGHSSMVSWSDDGQRLFAGYGRRITTWDASAGYECASGPVYPLQRARALYRRALRLARSGDSRESDEIFQQARDIDADFPLAYLSRGDAYFDRDDFSEALSDYSEAIRLDPTLNSAYRKRAQLHVKRGKYDKAIKDAQQAVTLTPDAWRNWSVLGQAQFRAEKWGAAQKVLMKSQELCRGGDARNWLFLAMTYWQLGDMSKATHWYQKAEQRISQCDDEDEELLDVQGEAAKLLGGLAEALWRLGHGDRLWESEQYGQAVVESRRAIELLEDLTGDPAEQIDVRDRLAEAYLSLGQRLYGLERREDAQKILATLRDAFPDQPKYADRLAHTYELQDEATQEHATPQFASLNRAIRLNPDSAPPFADRGKAYFEKGDCGKAIEDFSQAIQCAPTNPEHYRSRGASYRERGEWAKALADLDECIRLRGSAQDYQERSLICLHAHAYDRAISDFEDAFRRYHADAIWMNIERRGAAFLKKGQLAKALDDLDRAIKANPEAHNAYYHRGCLHREKGNLDKALADFTQAISLKPSSGLFCCQRAVVYAELGRTDEASVDLKKAADITPGPARQMGFLACLLASLPGDLCRPERAIELAKQALEKSPTCPDAWEALGIGQYRAGNWQGAADALAKSIELSVQPTARGLLFLGMAHWQLGEKDEARRGYQRAVERLEKHEYADYQLRRFRAEAADLMGIEE